MIARVASGATVAELDVLRGRLVLGSRQIRARRVRRAVRAIEDLVVERVRADIAVVWLEVETVRRRPLLV